MHDFYVYILLCKDNSFYVGHTDDIDVRLAAHEQRHYPGCYTAKRLPVKLVFFQEASSRDDAFRAERQIKKWTRKKKEALINGDFDVLQKLAKKKFKNM